MLPVWAPPKVGIASLCHVKPSWTLSQKWRTVPGSDVVVTWWQHRAIAEVLQGAALWSLERQEGPSIAKYDKGLYSAGTQMVSPSPLQGHITLGELLPSYPLFAMLLTWGFQILLKSNSILHALQLSNLDVAGYEYLLPSLISPFKDADTCIRVARTSALPEAPNHCRLCLHWPTYTSPMEGKWVHLHPLPFTYEGSCTQPP